MAYKLMAHSLLINRLLDRSQLCDDQERWFLRDESPMSTVAQQ
jgi:hypothetical protein